MTSPLPAHHRQFDELGAHLAQQSGQRGVYFGVWAPHARTVAVVGDFNGWQPAPLSPAHDGSGRWTGFVAGAQAGDCYKYRIETADGQFLDKADPFALCSESPPRTASRVWSLDHTWHDAEWMEKRAACQSGAQPISIYEVHLGSWQRADDGEFLNYRELAQRLAAHCQALNFTHVELMPVAEHPFYGSWGYQITGYFAPTSRYGSPQDLMDLVDTLHQHGIGVLLDWVPSHFPSDAHGLATFDGTALYEHPDTRRGFQPQWKSLVFNYGRYEVRDFLISNAIFWLEKYHFDGLRVDAVASMLYLDFAREPGQWVPNPDGGNENFDATTFMRALNTAVGAAFPGVHMVAEESSSWAGVSRPVDVGGLGFGMKWNMGWMNDLLRYTARPHFFREHHGDDIRFSIWYAFNENFVLPLSHDEVVHGKYSLLQKQPGDEWQRFAGLRVVYGLMWAHLARSCYLWAANLRRCASGTTTVRSTGTCGTSHYTPVSPAGLQTSMPCTARSRPCTGATLTATDLPGPVPKTTTPPSCVFFGAPARCRPTRRRARYRVLYWPKTPRCSPCATSHPRPTRPGVSVCPTAAAGTSC